MNRRKKLYYNTITVIINQLVALICGFILPRFILSYFGSNINGLVTSMTRFLGVISFLQLGVGSVFRSNLYKPLAENDMNTVSKMVVSAERFYRQIAYIFLGYIVALLFVFPTLNREYDFWFTASLLLIVSISTFAQYYFGITYQIFLNADQKEYVHTIVQIVTTILNTLFCVLLMKLGCGIHIVKLASASVFVMRPLVQNLYVKKNYIINRKITYTEEPIKQKWNGFAQHLTAVVSKEIDVVLLTFFSTNQYVSIYSVYLLVAGGINNMVITSVSGLESFWGNMLAKKEYNLLNKTFESVEALVHAGVTFLFVVTAILITPFVSVYTKGIADAESYFRPLFGILLTFAYGVQCLRIPYFRIIKAAGHYKETQNGFFIAMIINIAVSTVLVFKFQLVGVALGTLVAMLYHTVYFAWYLRKNIIHRPFSNYLKHMIIDIIAGIFAFLSTGWVSMNDATYIEWIRNAIVVSLIVGGIVFIINMVFYKKEFAYLIKKILKKA